MELLIESSTWHNKLLKQKKGYKIVAVVSAMGNTTNELFEKAKTINPNPSSQELDMLLATGEQITISLLAMAVQALDQDVISLTRFQCGILTDTSHKKSSN
ncbi:MAG: hypothetical protein KAX49_04700 [Halanaerobiales bacterium]|nr:hypothetical protein [Halanaerobiales bacterium]